MMKLQKITLRMYGDYNCSCGCNKPLGNPGVTYTENDICIGVGEEDDDEGFGWKMFRPECWERLQLDNKSLDYIYKEV